MRLYSTRHLSSLLSRDSRNAFNARLRKSSARMVVRRRYGCASCRWCCDHRSDMSLVSRTGWRMLIRSVLSFNVLGVLNVEYGCALMLHDKRWWENPVAGVAQKVMSVVVRLIGARWGSLPRVHCGLLCLCVSQGFSLLLTVSSCGCLLCGYYCLCSAH